jgi:outer membrane protein assembly factor BamD (BamD/ComL family)
VDAPPVEPTAAPSSLSASAPSSPARATRDQSASAARAQADASTLAEENSLYEAASRALREGHTAAGITALDQLLSRYPRAPLAQNAVVERFRALRRAGRDAEAVAQARQYLASYPHGFARDEAKAIVEASLPSSE